MHLHDTAYSSGSGAPEVTLTLTTAPGACVR